MKTNETILYGVAVETNSATQAMQWRREGRDIIVNGITVHDATQPERDAAEENRAYCKHIALELDEYAAGAVRKCPNCGEIHAREWDEVGDKFKCPHCSDVDSPDEWEVLSLWDYMCGEVLDTTWIIDSNHEYEAARFFVTLGGPSCWIDTEHKTVELRWGGESARYRLSWDTAVALDEFAEEIWGNGGVNHATR